mmetsp:Transcript_29844/g.80812  ORF Transcript_29844/g.80812 Transcript_29844/m.80812 type:complete len:215 (-) Transcript_29844:631-1275(-)
MDCCACDAVARRAGGAGRHTRRGSGGREDSGGEGWAGPGDAVPRDPLRCRGGRVRRERRREGVPRGGVPEAPHWRRSAQQDSRPGRCRERHDVRRRLRERAQRPEPERLPAPLQGGLLRGVAAEAPGERGDLWEVHVGRQRGADPLHTRCVPLAAARRDRRRCRGQRAPPPRAGDGAPWDHGGAVRSALDHCDGSDPLASGRRHAQREGGIPAR